MDGNLQFFLSNLAKSIQEILKNTYTIQVLWIWTIRNSVTVFIFYLTVLN